MVRENGSPVPPELTEFLSEIERVLTELLPQTADRRPALEAERERLERQIRGWTQSLGNPELHPAVRTSLERETTQGHQRLLEIEDELHRETVCNRSAQEAVHAEAALERLGSVLELHFPGPGRSSQDGSFDGRGLARRARRWSTSV